MTALAGFCAALAALWIALGGVVVLMLGAGPLEVVALQLAALVFAVLSATALLLDNRRPR